MIRKIAAIKYFLALAAKYGDQTVLRVSLLTALITKLLLHCFISKMLF